MSELEKKVVYYLEQLFNIIKNGGVPGSALLVFDAESNHFVDFSGVSRRLQG